MEDCRIRRSEFIGVPPVYTGVVFLLSWIYLLFYAQTAGIEAAAPVSLMSGPYLVSALVMSLTLLAISFAPFGRVEFLTASFAKIAAPFSMVVGTVVLMADPPLISRCRVYMGWRYPYGRRFWRNGSAMDSCVSASGTRRRPWELSDPHGYVGWSVRNSDVLAG